MVDPEELARQLTLIEYALYHAIKPWEFLGLAWSKNRERAPNIIALINWSNHAGALVWTTILQSADAKERAQTLRHWIRTADHCRTMKNFNAVMEILSALGNACVNRLKQTFTLLPSKEAKVLEELRALMSPNQNSKAIRDHMVVVDPPCIPYLGLFLTDLTFIEDGN
ncbi:MAG: RasGEF domain-containing protein, partial [archaeon]|nr:RasGEF domain-containing protein [archaeon]